MKHLIIGILGALSLFAVAAQADECPAKGEQFIKDNFLVKWTITSTGEAIDPLLGCPFTNQDGERHYERLNMIPYLNKVSNAPSAKPKVQSFGPLATGVYECDVPISIGGMIQGTPSTGHFFGLYDGKNYRDFNGKKGTYKLSGDILSMVTGPLKGIKYKRTGAKFFKPMDKNGSIGSISCHHTKAKSLKGKW